MIYQQIPSLFLISSLLSGFPVYQPVSANQSILIAQSQWSSFSSSEGKFRVLLPKPPTQSTQSSASPMGEAIVMHTFMTEVPSGAYSVSYAEFPTNLGVFDMFPEMRSKLENMIASKFVDEGAKVLSQRKVQLSGYSGTEIQYEMSQPQPSRSVIRTYFVDTRAYFLGVTVPSSAKQASAETANKFFDSFQLLND
jgi:hypothetical protein